MYFKKAVWISTPLRHICRLDDLKCDSVSSSIEEAVDNKIKAFAGLMPLMMALFVSVFQTLKYLNK